jgi:hypothetical protein
MDQALTEFRQAAARENRGRRGLQRRYSPALQEQAVHYWQRRQRGGEGARVVAAALGVAPWSLYRWIQASKTSRRFRPVQVMDPAPERAVSGVVMTLTADGPRIEGLDVEAAARLLALMR